MNRLGPGGGLRICGCDNIGREDPAKESDARGGLAAGGDATGGDMACIDGTVSG